VKKSVVLIEVIFSIVLFSIIVIGSMKMVYSLYKTTNTNTFETVNNIKLESTRLFLIKNNDMTKLHLNEGELFFDDNLLLNEVSTFKITNSSNIANIHICLYEDVICQTWKIKI